MRGILFKPDMIKAIAEGRKTVTRRLSGLEKVNQESSYITRVAQREGIWSFYHSDAHILDYDRKPRYQAGETVYVKETWAPCGCGRLCKMFVYRLDAWPPGYIKWHSPMMMPEKAARTFLVIKSVHPERLQEISEEDVDAEGTREWLAKHPDILDYAPLTAKQTYAHLWDSINPQHPWGSNPWVWRYEFEVKP